MLGITDDSGMKKVCKLSLFSSTHFNNEISIWRLFSQSANKTKRKRRSVTFNDEEIIINPEDVDPAIGRFRNMIQTTVVPTKRTKYENHMGVSSQPAPTSFDGVKHMHPSAYLAQFYQELPSTHLYQDLPPTSSSGGDGDHQKINSSTGFDGDIMASMTNIGSKLGLVLPNPAPDVAPAIIIEQAPTLPTTKSIVSPSKSE